MEIKEMKVKRKRIVNEFSELSGWVTGSLVKTERTQLGYRNKISLDFIQLTVI